MSQLSLRTPAGGTINITAEDTAVSKTLTLPADDSPLVSNESLLQTFNAAGSAPVYACRAWVNFTGSTGTIASSGNVSSITRHGVGDYTVNFATAMPDANYAMTPSVACGSVPVVIGQNESTATKTVTQLRIKSMRTDNNTVIDRDYTSITIFR